eukprot:SAG11_NODE_20664_length_440_cov_10.023460_1_plen_78_part_01
MACIWAYPHVYSGKSRKYKNFEKLIPQNFACGRLGGTTVRNIYSKGGGNVLLRCCVLVQRCGVGRIDTGLTRFPLREL